MIKIMAYVKGTLETLWPCSIDVFFSSEIISVSTKKNWFLNLAG